MNELDRLRLQHRLAERLFRNSEYRHDIILGKLRFVTDLCVLHRTVVSAVRYLNSIRDVMVRVYRDVETDVASMPLNAAVPVYDAARNCFMIIHNTLEFYKDAIIEL